MPEHESGKIDALPPGLPAMWRALKRAHESEPRLLSVSFALSLLAALPDALLALWMMLLANGVVSHNRTLALGAGVGLGVSAAATWFLRVISDRTQRRFRDRVAVALESHVAKLQASVATIAHHERPEYLDRLAMLRDQVFVLDHMYMSLFATCGWILRLGVTVALLMSIHPALALLAAFALPTVLTSTWRPGVERAAEERGAAANRLARHLFILATTAPPGKEVRVTRIGDRLVERAARDVGAVVPACGGGALGQRALAHPGLGDFRRGLRCRGGVRRIPARSHRGRGAVGAGRGGPALGVHRRDGGRNRIPARLLAGWLPAHGVAGGLRRIADRACRHAGAPASLEGIRFEHVSFAYPGTSRRVLEDVSLELKPGAVVAIVGENGAGKSTLVKLLCRMYQPEQGRILVDGVDLAQDSSRRMARAPRWRVSGFLPLRVSGAAERGSRGRAAARRSTRGDRRLLAAPAPTMWWRSSLPASRRSSAPPGRAAWRSASANGRSSRWPAGSCAIIRCCWCWTNPPRRWTPRPSTLCSSATRWRLATSDAGRPHYHPGVASVQHRTDGRPDRGAGWRAGSGGGIARSADGERRTVRRALRHPGRGISLTAFYSGFSESDRRRSSLPRSGTPVTPTSPRSADRRPTPRHRRDPCCGRSRP